MVALSANSGNPNQIPQSAAYDLSLHCLPVTRLRVSSLKWVNLKTPISWTSASLTTCITLPGVFTASLTLMAMYGSNSSFVLSIVAPLSTCMSFTRINPTPVIFFGSPSFPVGDKTSTLENLKPNIYGMKIYSKGINETSFNFQAHDITLKVLITTAAEDIAIFFIFQKK